MDEFTAAIQEVAHDYGCKRLAADMGISHQVLLNQLNPMNDRPVSLNKFWQIVRITQDKRAIQPLLDEMGLVAVKRTEIDADEEMTLAQAFMRYSKAGGELAAGIVDATEDGVIDSREQKLLDELYRKRDEADAAIRQALAGMRKPDLKLA